MVQEHAGWCQRQVLVCQQMCYLHLLLQPGSHYKLLSTAAAGRIEGRPPLLDSEESTSSIGMPAERLCLLLLNQWWSQREFPCLLAVDRENSQVGIYQLGGPVERSSQWQQQGPSGGSSNLQNSPAIRSSVQRPLSLISWLKAFNIYLFSCSPLV